MVPGLAWSFPGGFLEHLKNRTRIIYKQGHRWKRVYVPSYRRRKPGGKRKSLWVKAYHYDLPAPLKKSKPKLKPAAPPPSSPPSPKPVITGPAWVSVPDYLIELEKLHQHSILVVNPLVRLEKILQARHWIRRSDFLLWERRIQPALHQPAVCGVWMIVKDSRTQDLVIYLRAHALGPRQKFYQRWESRSEEYRDREILPSPRTWAELLNVKELIVKEFSDWIAGKDYLESIGLVCWSFWQWPPGYDAEKVPKLKKRKGRPSKVYRRLLRYRRKSLLFQLKALEAEERKLLKRGKKKKRR